ncbi:hypothetical protein [Anoxybacillus flavithermus]|uniref:hypothetical protein n=1 Tax=Anoxybacillus flavithermus TaxID=33934 RepID=UPI0018681D65|nr:hypothetical protein [Anoxybacillus flavithermus]
MPYLCCASLHTTIGVNSYEEEAEDIIKKALKHDGPVLLDFNIAEEENVYPIVPPGQSNEQVILSH